MTITTRSFFLYGWLNIYRFYSRHEKWNLTNTSDVWTVIVRDSRNLCPKNLSQWNLYLKSASGKLIPFWDRCGKFISVYSFFVSFYTRSGAIIWMVEKRLSVNGLVIYKIWKPIRSSWGTVFDKTVSIHYLSNIVVRLKTDLE